MSSSSRTGRKIGDYEITGKIGTGAFAVVLRAVHSASGAEVAIKSIAREKLKANPKHQENLESEILIMKQLDHPNLVRLLEVIPSEKYIHLIMEFCKGGDLSTALKKSGSSGSSVTGSSGSASGLPEELARVLFVQIVNGLKCLHKHGITHRDLKPQNLLLTSKDLWSAQLKIGDFGFARKIEPDSMIETLCGSPLYMAPELLRFKHYDAKADLWSLGTILYEMLCGKPPYQALNIMDLLKQIEEKEIRIPAHIKLSSDCIDLLKSLLKRNAIERISFAELFKHPFIKESEFAFDESKDDSGEFVVIDGATASHSPAPAPSITLKPSSGSRRTSFGKTRPSFGKVSLTERLSGSTTKIAEEGSGTSRRSPSEGSPLVAPTTTVASDFGSSASSAPKPEATIAKPKKLNLSFVSDTEALEAFRSMYQRAFVISVVAESKLKRPFSLETPEAFALAIPISLYVEALSIIQQLVDYIAEWKSNATGAGTRPTILDSVKELYTKAYQLLTECLRNARSLRDSLIAECSYFQCELSDVQTDRVEKILFQAALEEARESVMEETMGDRAAARVKSLHAYWIIRHLLEISGLEKSDRDILEQYAEKFKGRSEGLS